MLLQKLDEWNIADNTFVISLGIDNGGAAGRDPFNAGMKRGKGTTYHGGILAPCFFREMYGTFDWYPEFDKPLAPSQGHATRTGWTNQRDFAHSSVFVYLDT